MPITVVRLSACAAALAIITLAGPAWCTEPSDVSVTDDPLGYGYVFHDDALQAGGFGPRDAGSASSAMLRAIS